MEHGGQGHGHGHQQNDECPSYDIISKCYQNVTGYYDWELLFNCSFMPYPVSHCVLSFSL